VRGAPAFVEHTSCRRRIVLSGLVEHEEHLGDISDVSDVVRDTKSRSRLATAGGPRGSRAPPPHAACRTDGRARYGWFRYFHFHLETDRDGLEFPPRDGICADELAVIAGPSTDRVIIHTTYADRARFTFRSLAVRARTRTTLTADHTAASAIRRHETKPFFTIAQTPESTLHDATMPTYSVSGTCVFRKNNQKYQLYVNLFDNSSRTVHKVL